MKNLLLSFGLVLVSCSLLKAQPLSLSLLYGPPNTPPETWSTGNVFQVGNQFGDASIYALFSGNGTQSFQITSPAENATKTITGSGYFNIRPTGNITVDRTKILNFAGTVSGSVAITVRTLTIATQLNTSGTASPGATLPVTFNTGVGTFPIGIGFQVQLLDANGTLIQNLPSNPSYTTREPATFSTGDQRSIPAVLPSTLAAGTYRVRVVSTGLATSITGTSSATFQVQAALGTVNTVITNITPHTICSGYTGNIELTWTATDDGSQNQRYVIGVFSENASITDTPIRTIANQGIYTSTSGTNKALVSNTTLLNSLPIGRYKIAILHSTATTNASFSNPFVVAALPTAIISDGTANINEGEAASVRLTFTGQGPWSYSYSDLRNGVQTVTNSTNNPVLLTLYPTTDYTFTAARILSFSGLCGNGTVSGSSQIRVSRLPTLALTSVSHPNTCPGNTITVSFTSSSAPTGTRYRLQFSDANGSFTNPREIGSGTTSPLTGQTPANDAPGTSYKVRVVADNLPSSGTADVTLTRPAPPTVSDYSFCLGGTPPILTASGNSLQWFSADDIGQAYGSTAPTPPNDRSSSYRVTQTVNSCPSSSALIKVTATAKSATPTVSTPITYCQGQPATALTAQGSGLLWYNDSRQSIGPNGPTPNTNNAGNQAFYVSQDQNGCRSDLVTVTVTVTVPPAAPLISSPAPVCQFSQVANTVLSAAVNGQNLRWYDVEQGGSANSQAPAPRTSTDGTERYYVSQVINGCESNRARLEQTVIKAPDRPIISANPVLYCLNDTPRSLTVNGSNLRWYEQTTGGNYSTNAPQPSTRSIGTTSYFVSQVAGNYGCESQRLQVNVQVLSQPNAPIVTANQFLCQNAPATPLRAEGAGLQWSGPGITGTSGTAPTPPTNTTTTLTYQVSQQVGACSSPASTIQVTIRPQPTPPTVESPVKLCQGASARTLTASGQNLRWYKNAEATDYAGELVSFLPTSTGVFNYYVKQVVNSCESLLSRLEVRVSVPARATLSGDSLVMLHDSTAIRIRFTGDAPYTLKLWNGKLVETFDNPLIVWVKPTAADNFFKLQELQNDCGKGDPGNTYRLTVLSPLGTEDEALKAKVNMRVFPNPATSPVSIEWTAPARESVVLKATSLNGASVWESHRKGTGSKQTESLPVDSWAAGIYMVTLSTDSGQVNARILITR